MSQQKVLVIEDEEDILHLISFNLKKEGYDVSGTTTGEEGLKMATQKKPDVILLDVMLPGMDGLDVLRTIKGDNTLIDTPVVIVSARGEEIDVVTGLEMGASDYISKPFRVRELVARVRTALRGTGRTEPEDVDVMDLGTISIDRSRRDVRVDGKSIELRYTEFEILCLLARRRGIVFTRGQIVDTVRGQDYAVTERSVDVHIAGIRKKLGRAGELIETVRSVGYRMRDDRA